KGVTKTEEVIPVLREVNRATEELERMKGRQRVLENLTELTTVTVHIQERGTYTPNEPTAFGATVDKTFWGSIDALTALGKGGVLVVVALTPWLPVLAVVSGILWWIVRRQRVVVPVVQAAAPAQAKGP